MMVLGEKALNALKSVSNNVSSGETNEIKNSLINKKIQIFDGFLYIIDKTGKEITNIYIFDKIVINQKTTSLDTFNFRKMKGYLITDLSDIEIHEMLIKKEWIFIDRPRLKQMNYLDYITKKIIQLT